MQSCGEKEDSTDTTIIQNSYISTIHDPKSGTYFVQGDQIPFKVSYSDGGKSVVKTDIFLDGNSFANSHSIDKEPLVGDALVGASLTLRNWKLSYSQALRTSEFEGQHGVHKFGSISLSYTF